MYIKNLTSIIIHCHKFNISLVICAAKSWNSEVHICVPLCIHLCSLVFLTNSGLEELSSFASVSICVCSCSYLNCTFNSYCLNSELSCDSHSSSKLSLARSSHCYDICPKISGLSAFFDCDLFSVCTKLYRIPPDDSCSISSFSIRGYR